MSSPLLVKRAALLAASVVMLVYVLAPVAWLVSSSLQREADITSIPPHWIPHPPTLASFRAIIDAGMGTVSSDESFVPSTAQYLLPALRNSLIVAVAVVVLNLLVSIPAAYAMAKIRYIGRDLSVYFMLATRVIPDIALVVPFFLFASSGCSTTSARSSSPTSRSPCRSAFSCCSVTSRACPTSSTRRRASTAARGWTRSSRCSCRSPYPRWSR
jgi:ABC-type glycerol-3-phosphate transport system permease component